MDRRHILIGAQLIIAYLGIAYLHFTNTRIEKQTAILVMFISHTLSTSALLCLGNGWFDDYFVTIGTVGIISCFVTLGALFSIVY